MLWPMRKLLGALVAFGFLATAAPAFACPHEDKGRSDSAAAENQVAKKDAPKKPEKVSQK